MAGLSVERGMGSPAAYDLQGQGGGVVVTSASGTVTGKFRWIQVITDAVISSLSSNNLVGASGLVGISVNAGVGIGGSFQSIAVTSGVVIVYTA